MKKNNHLDALEKHFAVPVSCYQNVYSKEAVTTTLSDWLRSIMEPKTAREISRKEQVLQYRQKEDSELKRQIPIFTPGALMNHRNKTVTEPPQLKMMTGWMQFDVDAKDNRYLGDAAHLRDEISKIVFVAFCSISTSGKGVWGLVKVKYLNQYREHFEQLKKDFGSLGVTLDPSKGGNPADPRFYTYDPEAYIASDFKLYDRVGGSEKPERPNRIITALKNRTDTWQQVAKVVTEVTQRGLDIAPDYDTYVKLGFALANEFGEQGRHLFHVACQPSPKYNRADADKQFTACIRAGGKGITLGTFYHLAKEVGLG